jgi:hypothetical protein
MKTLFLILFSFSALASSEYQEESDKLKWLRLGYEIARAHAPDEDIAFHIAQESGGEDAVKRYIPDVDVQDAYHVPTGHKTIEFYDIEIGKDIYIYKCITAKEG